MFAWRLRAVRRAYGGSIGMPGLSARQFAKHLNIDPWRYRRYERAEIEPPLGVLTTIRRLTGVCLTRLITGDEPGDPDMIPARGLREDETVILGDRMRWVREAGEPDIGKAAALLHVSPALLQRWEAGATRPPLDKLQEFAVRFRVTTDFLLVGAMDGLEAWIRELLVSRHPELAQRPSAGSTAGARHLHTAPADTDRSGTGLEAPRRLAL
jgi:transcriptional regulator with XRE-family HTH domain